MKLAEPERRPALAKRDGDEPAAVAAFGGFILHPGRCDRGFGPQDDDRFGILERAVDLVGEPRAALDMPVPPDLVTRAGDAARQLLRRVARPLERS